MPRLLACLLVVALLTGCYHAPQQPMQNPFVGQTTVPPPGTGTSQTLAPPPSSYYQPPANAPYIAPQPQTATPGPMSPNPSYAPPGGTYGAPQGYPQSSYVRPQPYVAGTVDRAAGQSVANAEGWRVPAPATRAIGTGAPTVVARPSSGVGLEEFSSTSRPPISYSSQDASAGAATPAVHHESYVQHIEPRHGEPIRIIEPTRTMPERSLPVQQASVRPATPPPAEPARFQPRGNLVDIADLPEPRRNTEVQQAVYRAQEPAPRRSVYAVASPPAETWSRDEVDVDGRYDVDPDYRWLRGRLVHDEAADQWRLDYVAPGAAVDEFGGSVVLHDAALLENFRSGDYVLVHGVLDDESIELDAPAWYHVEQIVRTAD